MQSPETTPQVPQPQTEPLPEPRHELLSNTAIGLLIWLCSALVAAAVVFLLAGCAARAWHWMAAGIY